MCLRPGCDYEFDEVWDEQDGLLFQCPGPDCGVVLTEAEAREVCAAQNAHFEADPEVEDVPVLQRAS